jgi:transcription initiation factor TFIIIB Brf1 subunit/transcription initiation factor TFIIB
MVLMKHNKFRKCIVNNDVNEYFNNISKGIEFTTDKYKVNTHQNSCTCDNSSLKEDFRTGTYVCISCGLVQSDNLDNSPEWKQYDTEDKTSGRCSYVHNNFLSQSSIGTTIGGHGGNNIKKISRWMAMSYTDRSLNEEFKKIQEASEKGHISNAISNYAKIIYKKISECEHPSGINKGKKIITRGKNRLGINAGCLFQACAKKGVMYTTKEIAVLYNIKESMVSSGIKKIRKFFRIKNFDMELGVSKPEQYIKRICDELEIKTIHTQYALKIARNINILTENKTNIAPGHTSYSLAAASILLMAEINNIKTLTKKNIAKKFNISEVTITKTFKKIEPYISLLINDDIKLNLNINNTNANDLWLDDVIVLHEDEDYPTDITISDIKLFNSNFIVFDPIRQEKLKKLDIFFY